MVVPHSEVHELPAAASFSSEACPLPYLSAGEGRLSRVHAKAGDTGWTQSYSCDFCPATVERKPTGEKAYSFDMDHERMEVEYDEQRFEPHALDGWGSMSRGRDDLNGDHDNLAQNFDMCPTCFQVMLDTALERAKQMPTSVEQKFGTLIPMRPVGGTTTNVRQGELGQAPAAASGGPVSVPIRASNMRDSNGRLMVFRCHSISRHLDQSRCRNDSVPGSFYCYDCAARAPR